MSTNHAAEVFTAIESIIHRATGHKPKRLSEMRQEARDTDWMDLQEDAERELLHSTMVSKAGRQRRMESYRG